jgi:cyclopropane fatty-acyl-phospholipid synthase-like methyltransferase
MYTKDELVEILSIDQYPRSGTYDPEWVLENQMGPNVLWLTEALIQGMELEPGMRILDMGCGKAISSIFLAREFDVQVWATDLWIEARENWTRIREAGLEEQVYPIHAEAHTLPFADEFFDAIVSMDAYHYFGTDDLYLGYICRFLKPGGQIGIHVPGIKTEFGIEVPEHLEPYWDWDFCSFHSPQWWREHWGKTGKVEVQVADRTPDGWKLWRKWEEICYDRYGKEYAQREVEMLSVDKGRNIGFSRVVARKKAENS